MGISLVFGSCGATGLGRIFEHDLGERYGTRCASNTLIPPGGSPRRVCRGSQMVY